MHPGDADGPQARGGELVVAQLGDAHPLYSDSAIVDAGRLVEIQQSPGGILGGLGGRAFPQAKDGPAFYQLGLVIRELSAGNRVGVRTQNLPISRHGILAVVVPRDQGDRHRPVVALDLRPFLGADAIQVLGHEPFLEETGLAHAEVIALHQRVVVGGKILDDLGYGVLRLGRHAGL